MQDDRDQFSQDADLTPGRDESDMTGDATEQVTGMESTASVMESSGLSGSGAGAFGSAAALQGDAEGAMGAVTADGRRLRMRFPAAPGGTSSPQAPGATPDFSTIPGERVARSPAVDAVRHPAVEAGTAEGIMRFHDAAPGEESDPERFELGLTSFEEQRKSRPSLRTPVRPVRSVSGLGESAWQRPAIAPGEVAPAAALSALTKDRDRS